MQRIVVLRALRVVSLLLISVSLHAQNGRSYTASASVTLPATWTAGFGGGVVFGTNESHSHTANTQLRISGLAFNGITPGVSPEVGLTLFTLESEHQGGWSDYRTNLIAPDLRVRVSPFTDITWFPYASVGVGFGIYSVQNKAPNADVQARLHDATLFFPMGVGLYHQISDDLGVELDGDFFPTISDDINPVHDGTPDGWMSANLSLFYAF